MAAFGMVALALMGAYAWIAPSSHSKLMATPAPGPALHLNRATPSAAPATAPAPEEEIPTAASPDHGWLQMEPRVLPRVPLRIETDPGRDYLVTLLDAKTGGALMTFFLQGGVPYHGLAPEGDLQLEYTSGTRWLGPLKGFAGDPLPIRSDQRFQIAAGPTDAWAWHLWLHARHFEASPVSPRGLKHPDSGH
jgi:hypothetical protein